jgi:hypothetical protein
MDNDSYSTGTLQSINGRRVIAQEPYSLPMYDNSYSTGTLQFVQIVLMPFMGLLLHSFIYFLKFVFERKTNLWSYYVIVLSLSIGMCVFVIQNIL